MALHARLSAPRPDRTDWLWHHAKCTAISSAMMFSNDRRMEAETYVSSGYGIRLALEAHKTGWACMDKMARVWQPSRLKGIQVSPEFGTPFLAATQVFDLRPVPRKWLSLDRTDSSAERFVTPGMILVTCSGNVGRATLAYRSHENILISHDLLRVEPLQEKYWGWLYAYLRSPQARAMMSAAQYGHIIKHLEVSHLNALPVPMLRDDLLAEFNDEAQRILDKRNQAHEMAAQAEACFEKAIGSITPAENPETGFVVHTSSLFGQRRRLESAYHTTNAAAILSRFTTLNFKVDPLSELWECEWQVTRNKTIFDDHGVPYMSADDLFSLNTPISKRIAMEQIKEFNSYAGRAGWIVMACSGQVYGLNGSVMLLTKRHESFFLSQDLIRIIPRGDLIRSGYLFVVLSHPELGRPLVIRYAYGTSIPHLEPADVATFPVVRLGNQLETEIADLAEQAIALRAEADELENDLAADAETLIDRFLAGDSRDFILTGPK